MHPLSPEQQQAYLAHLDMPGQADADRANLDRLIAAHLNRVPFENVDVLLDRPIGIDAEATFAKIVERGRGGYCFEANSLFARLLLSLGYRVSLLAGRVRWGLADSAPQTMLSHLLLCVELAQGPFLVDIAFGSATPFRAMPLHEPSDLPDLPFRLLPPNAEQPHYQLQTRVAEAWLPVYHFDLQASPWIDFAARNWYTATHPQSIFRQMLMAARTDGSTRLTLANGTFKRHYADGRVEQRLIESAAEVLAVLRNEFLLNLDPDLDCPLLKPRLQALLQPSA